MRIGIVSDIHCNLAGLERALELMAPFDALLCAGDSVFQFRWSNDVVARLRELGAYVVQGNHEETILSRDGERAISSPKVDQELVAWMREQPFRMDLVFDGKRVLLTHGSPWEPWKEYHYPHETIWAKAASLDTDVVVVGHTHFKMAQRFGDVLVINPGSASDPRDSRNDFQLSCAVWDTTSDEVTFYDYPDPTRNFVASSGQLT
ncbi:MAG: YfcE family phosphodiesterase [Dehalococcoidia bacterium]|nr:YfcE family phosphodiesterase [Dehalococcoidia bacterium]